jgi:GNAT superfamily N-acetyltransferase
MPTPAIPPRIEFRPIDLDAHADLCIQFREDTTICGFGSAERFHEADGSGALRYLDWLRQRIAALPGSVVHAWEGERIVGQIEMNRLLREPQPLGYVNLFYLIPQRRGHGLGTALEAYAWQFLQGFGCHLLQLSASPSNLPAWAFYQRNGWRDLGPRADDPSVHLLEKQFALVDAAQ